MSDQENIKFHTESQYLNVDQISKNTWNPNYVSADMMSAITDDIAKHGFIGAIIVQKYNTEEKKPNVIINGEHRFDALVRLGATRVPCHVLDVNDKVARLLTLRLNREHGDLVPDKVVSLLGSLEESFDLNILSELTAMPMKELEMITALDITAEIPKMNLEQELGRPNPTLGKTNVDEVFGGELRHEDAYLHLTWDHIETLVKDLAAKIKATGKEYNMILAITRGGLIPARLLQRELGIKDLRLLHVDSKTKKVVQEPVLQMGSFSLIVDDIFDTWQTIKNVFEYGFDNGNTKAVALVAKEPVQIENSLSSYVISKDNANYRKWIVFPWEKGVER